MTGPYEYQGREGQTVEDRHGDRFLLGCVIAAVGSRDVSLSLERACLHDQDLPPLSSRGPLDRLVNTFEY